MIEDWGFVSFGKRHVRKIPKNVILSQDNEEFFPDDGNMTKFGKLFFTFGLLIAGFATADDKRPNILYIMSDDHAAHAIGAYGGRLAELNPTPTIDRLAKEGILFENAFATNSICTPSRACVITGQYAHTNGVPDLWGKIETARQFLPTEMKKVGYDTAMVGKWHLGFHVDGSHPLDAGFDEYLGLRTIQAWRFCWWLKACRMPA